MNNTWELTQLRAEMLEAISRRDWKRVYTISAEIQKLREDRSRECQALVNQLWPGARVGE